MFLGEQEERGGEGDEEGGGEVPVVVAVGAHYKPHAASPEETLLYIVKVNTLTPSLTSLSLDTVVTESLLACLPDSPNQLKHIFMVMPGIESWLHSC